MFDFINTEIVQTTMGECYMGRGPLTLTDKPELRGPSVAQMSEQTPFTNEVVGLTLTIRTHVKRVCQHSAEIVGFLRALRFPPLG
jgi:hypothetical protein